jgi:hypothetical protein
MEMDIYKAKSAPFFLIVHNIESIEYDEFTVYKTISFTK